MNQCSAPLLASLPNVPPPRRLSGAAHGPPQSPAVGVLEERFGCAGLSSLDGVATQARAWSGAQRIVSALTGERVERRSEVWNYFDRELLGLEAAFRGPIARANLSPWLRRIAAGSRRSLDATFPAAVATGDLHSHLVALPREARRHAALRLCVCQISSTDVAERSREPLNVLRQAGWNVRTSQDATASGYLLRDSSAALELWGEFAILDFRQRVIDSVARHFTAIWERSEPLGMEDRGDAGVSTVAVARGTVNPSPGAQHSSETAVKQLLLIARRLKRQRDEAIRSREIQISALETWLAYLWRRMGH